MNGWLIILVFWRVLEQLLKMSPNADLFAVVDFLPYDLRQLIQYKPVKTTFIQAFPLARERYLTQDTAVGYSHSQWGRRVRR